LKVFYRFLCFLFPILLAHTAAQGQTVSWQEIQKNKAGVITAYWYESKPFIYRDLNGNVAGIEYEVVEGFAKYLDEFYDIKVKVNWKEAQGFRDTYESIKNNRSDITVGISAFSITKQRQEDVQFTFPYMSDISVLITSDNIGIQETKEQFYKLLPKLKAITIEGTTYEQELLKLKTTSKLDFSIRYIPSNENIMTSIAATDSAFGFIDLPVYMLLFNEDPAINVKRQNFFATQREGYGLIFSKPSDWKEPFDHYFSNPNFHSQFEKIISKFLDLEVYRLVEEISLESNGNDVMILTKEKEIQYKELLGKSDQILKETRMRNFFIALASVITISLVFIIVLYKKSNDQNEKIEEQRESIEQKNFQLQERNHNLVVLDEEKNNLIKILAHDLRTPINHIQGLAQVVLNEGKFLSTEQRLLMDQIAESSSRVNKMITHLLDIDALEHRRVNFKAEEIDVKEVTKKIVSLFAKPAAKKQIALVVSEEGNENFRISVDKLFFMEILENLVSNALKFSSPGMTVRIYFVCSASTVQIRIQDQGPGIPKTEQQNLFKKFHKLTPRPTGGEGSFGLGLSIVKKYVDLMNGKVWCESEPEKGATFIVEFPRV
jgi:signal transduction histidine kinase